MFQVLSCDKLKSKQFSNFVWRQRTCEANPAGKNSSFIFTVCVKSVPLYRFKLAHVVLHMAVKEFSRNPLLQMGK